jgi:universal stress protein F
MYKKILFAIDYDDQASWDKALPVAVEEARLHGAALSTVSVVPEILKLPNLPDNYGDGAIQHVTKTIQQIVGDGVPVAVRQGSVYREILKEAHAIGADLIMMASPKGDFPDYLLGPNAARVVRHANCSVQIVRG